MKSSLKFMAMTAAILGLAASASAVPINGEVSFSGTGTVDNSNLSLATTFLSFSSVEVEAASGDYAGLVGTAVTMTPFSFDPFPVGGVVSLWSLVGLPGATFDLWSISIDFENAAALVLSGKGVAHMIGKEDKEGTWGLTANGGRTTFSFSSTTSVPDGGTTAMLLGLGFLTLGLVKRRLALR